MPWSGGVYTRGYPSWTNDANSNLPISATKFDLEDNDFAAGLNNCLTIDGLNKPNATLTWAQTLNLTRTDAATVFSIGHTGGTNNPSLAFSAIDSTGTILATLSGTLANLVLTGGTFTSQSSGGGSGSALGAAAALAGIGWRATGQGTDAKQWDFVAGATANVFEGRLVNDANSAVKDWLAITRAANVVSSIAFGNATDNPTYSFLGTGSVSAGDGAGNSFNLGFRDAPQNSQSGSGYTLVLADRGKQVFLGFISNTLTIPANASVPFPVGTTILVCNTGSGTNSVAITTDTLFLAGIGTTGTRTLAAFAMVTLTKITATSWFIAGVGVS
jgi:hypothetical protein